ncbi:hypothetical protein DFH29DRAFT_1083389 [Suillus ampliporus]|nr:hypothetical protein DFH29DRAFT_1083389 [Suillus ampliporus]
MNVRAEFQSLAEELQSHILKFLPWRDILRCSSVCKALRQAYVSSSELQYIVELGGQQLFPVAIVDLANHISISKRLQLLRDKPRAWFNFDLHSFQSVSISEQFHGIETSIADGHLCLWQDDDLDGHWGHSAKIFPILPKPSQQTIERHWSQGSLCSVPNARVVCVFMDPVQNLIAIAYRIRRGTPQEGRFYVELRALDGDGIHPQAAGQTLFVLNAQDSHRESVFESLSLKGFGRHLALQCFPQVDDGSTTVWWLQLWDWKHSTTSNSGLRDTIQSDLVESIDFCFVGNDRLLTASDKLRLYSIEDMSRKPQLLACYLLPVKVTSIRCLLPIDDITHGSQLQMQTQQTMWTSDPEHRLLCLQVVECEISFIFVISTRIFFDLECFGAKEWKYHGNLGVLQILSFPVAGTREYRLHMMDFSLLAVERRQGLGRVVREPSTVEDIESREFTTSLPYVEVVSDRVFDIVNLIEMWVDKDRLYLGTMVTRPANNYFGLIMDQLDVVEM